MLYMKMSTINNPLQFKRVKSHFENSDINLDNIAPIIIHENPS